MGHHPCGNLPVSTLSIHMHFCHHHMAWFGTIERWLQQGLEVEVLLVEAVEFGPFDALVDVQHWLRVKTGEAMMIPDHPWAS